MTEEKTRSNPDVDPVRTEIVQLEAEIRALAEVPDGSVRLFLSI
jgi:hypothetical protein